MMRATCDINGEWTAAEVEPTAPLPLPAAVLNYGQGIFEA